MKLAVINFGLKKKIYMIKKLTEIQNHKVLSFHPEVPTLKRPSVIRKGKDMYLGVGRDNRGKLYFKDQFDKMFSVTRTEIKPKHYKGKISERTEVLENDWR